MGKGIVKLGEGNWAVKDGNLLAAKETNGRFKNTEFTVSRGTRASYVGRDGLIKESNLQDVNLVNNGDFSELSSELVVNGTFDTDSDWTKTTGWSISNGNASYDGSGTGYQYVSQAITTTSGSIYKINFDVLSSTGSNLNIVDFGSVRVNQTHLSAGNYTYYAEADAASENLTIYANGTDTFSIDNVSVKEVDPNDYWVANTGWSIEDGEGVADNSSSYIKQNNVIDNNKTFKIQFDTVVTSGQFRLVATADAATYTSYVTESGSYTFYMKPTVSINGGLEFVASSFTGTIDNLVVNEVKTDTPRIDFTDNTDGHLLLEPQSTNLITYSEDFSEWTPTNATITQNVVTSPDGTVNADKLIGTSTTLQHRINFTSSNASGSTTFSFFAKSAEYNSCWARIGLDAAFFDLENGLTGGQSSGITSSIVNYGNGWYRCIMTKASSSANEVCRINITTSYLDDSDFLGDDTSGIYLYGGQHEQLSYPTSYIPTNGSTVTRDADTCTGAGDAIDFNSEEGVLYAEIAAFSTTDGSGNISLSDGTGNNRIYIYYLVDDAISVIHNINSSGAVINNFTLSDITNYTKIAARWGNSNFSVWINGTEVLDVAASNFTSNTLDLLNLAKPDGTGQLEAKVKALRVYKEALSDTDLQNLTS